MGKLAVWFETSKGKRVKNFIIGGGAAVVLVGALFKLQHWPGASLMLIIGMSVEAFIFMLQGILPPHKDYYWEKIYPELDISPEVEEMEHGHVEGVPIKGGTITQQLDNMLSEANIESELIERLGKNMSKLGDNIEAMSEISDVAASTSEYSENARQAAITLGEMKNAYSKATESVTELANATSGTKEYHDQVTAISKNLSQLNAMYELELQDTNNHLKAMNQFMGTLTEAMSNMNEAKDDTRAYKENMAALSKNLASLNGVYGNMLNAMKNPFGGNA